ncbi:CG5003 [Drosophila busckii]|uniref:CG5003 n=1 Tax=Drosophila busckii TaxID=30019 RepID=A0A0M3QYD4_DROBS|nr:CG5003 [Drosophila busckii]
MNNVHNAFVAVQKRRLSDNEPKQTDIVSLGQEEPESKQRKLEEQRQQEQLSPQEKPQEEHNLLSFCNELLYEIFKYLDSSSILAVMHCSPRFESLLLDHRFWHNIDLSNAPLPLGILEEILGRATEKTHTIKICGPPSSQHVAGEFKQFTCTLTSVFPKVANQLQVLELQGVSLDFEYIHISEFPSSLKRLTLIDCSVKVGDHVKSIFHTIEKQLVDLEDLSIEDNNWFEPYYIMALSKLPSLRRLSLKGCQMMCKFVPYGSMAARFGFQKLEALDLRITPINNSDLQCFSAIESLKELLLESPPNVPHEPLPAERTTNNDNEEQANVATPEAVKVLNDDEPSTSRAAMESLRAARIAQNNEQTSDTGQSSSDTTYTSDNCNVRKATVTGRPTSGSSESDDEETTSTSASSSNSSSDRCDSGTTQRATLHNESSPNPIARSPIVVIAMPRDVPPAPVNADNPEAPEAAAGGAGGVPTPRAYIYVQNGAPPENSPPQAMVSMYEHFMDQVQALRGNQPGHSRFLPRRDQVIYMNAQAVAEPMLVMHSRRHRTNLRGNFEQVVQHPMFWNMLDPLDRDYARRLRCRPQMNTSQPTHSFVSDRAIYSFGRAPNPVQPDVVWIRNSNRSPNNRLERMSLRNYTHITNYSLEHLAQCSPNLIYIDVSGTSVTLMGVINFENAKPNCKVIATHLAAGARVPQTEPQPEPQQDPAPGQEKEKEEAQESESESAQVQEQKAEEQPTAEIEQNLVENNLSNDSEEQQQQQQPPLPLKQPDVP